MNLNSSTQQNLYEHQEIFNHLSKLYLNNKLPNKILLSGEKGIGKATLGYHLINFVLSEDEEHSYDFKNNKINLENKSFKLIQNKSNPNFNLIDVAEDKKNIDINQIRELIVNLNKSSFNNKKRLRPFVKSGFGISGIDRGLFGDSIPFSQYFSKTLSPSFGAQFRITNHIGIEISSSFNKALDKKGISHLRHNFSVYLGLGDTDKDGDGIINRKDKCPKIPGLPEYNGCPDTDADGIPDPEDKCPEVSGELVNNGCPGAENLSQENKILDDENLENQIGTESPTISNNISSINKQSSEEKVDIVQEENMAETKLREEQMLIYFPANSSRVLGKTTIKKLKNVVSTLLNQMDLKVLLEGHSSNDGDFTINLNLSQQRVNIIKDFLMGEGIESNRISVKALGEDEPIFDNNTSQGRALNRCVLIIIK